MNEELARNILGDMIRNDKLSSVVPWMSRLNPKVLILDGDFTLPMLEAIVWWWRYKDG